MTARMLTLLACAGACALPVTALAQGPAFDCAKAQGEVEKRICADESLAAPDRQLDEVYRAASARATGDLANRLRADQRGWVKGRNECWKSDGQPTWITASWTVATVKDCVAAQYRLRTSELQSVWRLLPPETVSYACQGNPANEVVANFFATDPPTLRLERGDRTVTLWRVGAVAEGKYEGQNVSVQHRDRHLGVSWLNTDTGRTDELACEAP